jgi:hypothetical protein
MATRNPQSDSAGTFDDQSLSRYDLLLAAVPVPLVAGVAAAVSSSLPAVSGLGLGSALSMLFVLYGLFLDAPTV